jgi:hypothetical protein
MRLRIREWHGLLATRVVQRQENFRLSDSFLLRLCRTGCEQPVPSMERVTPPSTNSLAKSVDAQPR